MPRFFRRIIHVPAESSPNVALALAQIRAGKQPTGEEVLPGVLSWAEYQKREATWDEVKKCIGLRGHFYEGAQLLWFPPAWLNAANLRAECLRGHARHAKGIGIDPGEGGASTSMCASDELGIIELVSRKTPDTSVIRGEAAAFARKHNVPWERVVFDAGGGGVQIAAEMRREGMNVQTLGFGGPPVQDLSRGRLKHSERVSQREERFAYYDMRAALYGAARLLLDPSENPDGYGIPAEYTELRRQLAPIPLLYTSDGKMRLLPKSRPGKSNEQTLVQLLGCSPDEADSFCLSLFAWQHVKVRPKAGAAT